MTAKKWFIALIIVVIAGATVFILRPESEESNSTDSESTSQTSPEGDSTVTPTETFTAAQVAEHNSEEDCWTIIESDVYDITPYVSQHPGGDEILRACGTDATTLFTQRETSDGEEVGSGTPHSSDAERALKALQIGTLSE